MVPNCIAASLICLLFITLTGCSSDDRFDVYSKKNGGCTFAGLTADMNGANTGGVSSVFKCGNGKYYVRYGDYS